MKRFAHSCIGKGQESSEKEKDEKGVILVVILHVKEDCATEAAGRFEKRECVLGPCECSGGPWPPESGCRDISTSGMPSPITLACLVIPTVRMMGRKLCVLDFAGFHGYMPKLDFMIFSNISSVLYIKGNFFKFVNF